MPSIGARAAACALLPRAAALWDAEQRGSCDWMLVSVRSEEGGRSLERGLGNPGGVTVFLHDRLRRPGVGGKIAAKVLALLGGRRAAQCLGDGLRFEATPPGQGDMDAIVVVLGLGLV